MLHEDRRVALVQPAREEASWWRNADTPALFFSLSWPPRVAAWLIAGKRPCSCAWLRGAVDARLARHLGAVRREIGLALGLGQRVQDLSLPALHIGQVARLA